MHTRNAGSLTNARSIVFISEHDDPLAEPGGVGKGGQNVYVREVAQRLAKHDWQVDVFTRRESPHVPAVEHFGCAARVIRVSAGPAAYVPKEALAPYMPEFTHRMLALCTRAESAYQLVHGHYYLSGVLARTLQDRLNLPFVQTFHSLGAIKRRALGARDGSPDSRIATERAVGMAADCVVATSPQEQEDLTTLYRLPDERIRVIPCGVDVDRFQPVPRQAARAAWGFAPDQLLITFVGRIEPQKGIEVLLHAAARLRSLQPDLPFHVAIVGGSVRERHAHGWGPTEDTYTQSLESLARSLDIERYVTWTGGLPHAALPEIYSAADLVVIPSHYESFGMTSLEALACGACVVASRTGGLQTALDHGRAGTLFTPGAPDELADVLARLARHSELRVSFQRRARAYVTQSYGWDSIAARLSSVYTELVATKRQRAVGEVRSFAMAHPLLPVTS